MAASLPEINAIVVDKHTDAASSQYAITTNAQRIIFEGSDKNFELEISDIQKSVRRKLNGTVRDLYRIAAAVYVSDLRIARPDKLRSRSISILVSVSDKGKWDSVKTQLESMIRFISGDYVRFYFVQGDAPDSALKFAPDDSRSICLFSGGLDSLAGVKWLKDRAIRPVLISHCAMNRICHAQTLLASSLKKSFAGKLDFFQISARSKGGKKMNTVEYSQATRSFLFLSLASTFALSMGISKIRIFENGILGLNIPIVPSRIFNNTRTVHPTFLTKYNKLLSELFPNTVVVENPFILSTKGEVVKLLDDPDFRVLIKESVSCAHLEGLRWKKVTGSRHCGICLPCVLRRISVHNAKLDANDDNYVDNIFGDYDKIPQDGKTLLFQVLEFGRTLDRDDNDVLNDTPQFYVEEMNDPMEAIAMTRRYVAEAKTAIRELGSASLRAKLAPKLT
jgi:7-cyano-7-deazaguanine synthase in queuosine biosynthesis